MTRRDLVLLLYKEIQDSIEISHALSGMKMHERKVDGNPTKAGDYLVYHQRYQFCLYGFSEKHGWGDDDKVTHWLELDFLEDNK